jgi:putative hydrolase of the HAD superfamily
MKNSFIKVLFLDIGGVLLTNGWGHVSRKKAASHFNFDYDTMNDLHNMIFNIYEEGRVTLDHYLDTVLFYEPRHFSKEQFKEFMLQQSTELPQLLPWMIEWKQKHPHLKIFSINNEPKELNEYRIRRFDLKHLFDGFISSCNVGLRKPDPQIYKQALAFAAADPEECIYIDDREVLVRAGETAGILSIVHNSFEETALFLEQL